jgi:hypothetical protein
VSESLTRDEVGIVDLFHGFMDVENLDSYNNLTGKPPSESLICVVGIIDLLQLRSSFPFWYCDFTEGAINVDGSLSGISGSLFGAKFLFYIFCLNVCTFVGYSCIRIFPIHIHSDLATIYPFGSVSVNGKLSILFAQHNEQTELNEIFTRNGTII